MKHLLLLLTVLSMLSCSKSSDPAPEPDLGAEVAGNYQGSSIGTNGTYLTIPSTLASAGIVITRTDVAKADIIVTTTLSGAITKSTYNSILSKTGAVVTMRVTNTPVTTTATTLTLDGKKLVFSQTGTDGSQSIIEATKL